MRISRLTIFNHLWAIAGFCEWARWRYSEVGWEWALFAASALLIIFPNSIRCLAIFAVFQIIFTALAANSPWNHGLMMAIFNLAILLSIAHTFIARKKPSTSTAIDRDSENLVDSFAPALRLALIIVYFFTFFHKLNSDFLNPEVSCAGVILGWLNRTYHFLPLADWAIVTSIGATLIVELAVPVLLLFRPTVYIGIATGLGFHLFLSQYGGLYGFAAMLFAVYFLFLPQAFTDGVAGRIRALANRLQWSVPRRHWVPALALLLLVSASILRYFVGLNLIYTGMVFWDLWLLGVVICFGSEFVRLRRIPADYCLRQSWAPLWMIPIVAFLNGCSPYVGLKTETSWAMYSNLRTEIHPNHLLVPSRFKVFGYQDDLVKIVESSEPRLQRFADPEVALTFFEFRRICSSISGDFEVAFQRNGQDGMLSVVNGSSSNPRLTRPHPWLMGKLLIFRPVDTGAHAKCRH